MIGNDSHPPDEETRDDESGENVGNGAAGEGESSEGDPGDPIQQLQDEVADLKDKYMRAAAEAENIRRRASKERSDLLKYGLEDFFKDLLPVLDSFDKALPDDGAQSTGDDASFREGMVMVKKQLLDVLDRHGVKPVPARDEPFDPNVHQAIQRVEAAEVDQETVAEEYQRGYTLNGRLVRPSMVSVKVPTPGGDPAQDAT